MASRETINGLRRRGFGRLLVDGKAVAFEEIDLAALSGPHDARGRRRPRPDRGRCAQPPDRFDRNLVSRRRRSCICDSLTGIRVRDRDPKNTQRPETESPDPDPAIERLVFSERFECRPCGIAYETPQPRLFSFNNPFGACPTCHGFGNIIELDMALVVPDPSISINQGAIEPWSKPHYRAQLAELKRAARKARHPARRAVE